MTPKRRRALVRTLGFVLVVGTLFVAARFVPIEETISELRQWLRGFGVWAPVVFGLGYAVATMLGVPGTPLTVLAAVLFGPWVGVITMIVATSVAAIVGFALARAVIADQVEALLRGRPAYEKLQQMVETSPWTAIVFARLMPAFPFTLVNYTLGASRVPFSTYLLASEIPMVAMNFVWVFSADSVYAMVVRGEVPWGILVGSVAAAAVAFALMMVGRGRFSSPHGSRAA